MSQVRGIASSLPKEVTLLDGRKATRRHDSQVDTEVYFDETGQHVPIWDIQEALETDPVKRELNRVYRTNAEKFRGIEIDRSGGE